MSRSVSAPSSVTKTSPCWNGDIVPGSTFRYGSNFCSWTRSPRALSSRPSEAATIPLPSAETTPPVTNTYFGPRALTGFQGSSGLGGRLRPGPRPLPDERRQPRERPRRKRPADADQARRVHGERRLGLAVLHRLERQLGVEAVAAELEDDPPQRHDLQDEQGAAELGPTEEARPARPLHVPERPRRERAPHRRLHPLQARPPVGEQLGLGEERPDLVDRRGQGAPSDVPRQGTPARRASARARPAAPRRRAARSAHASAPPPSSRHGSGGPRRLRSAADG